MSTTNDTTLELGIQRLQRELAEARNKVVALCKDWADDDSRVKAIALQHGIDVDADAAKDGYFRTVVDVVEAMSAQLDTMRLAIKGADRSLSDLVEHISECDERDLLRCDSDPHPPSVFSVYAQQASASLAKLRPLLQ